MNHCRPTVFLLSLLAAAPAVAAPPEQRSFQRPSAAERRSSEGSTIAAAERWVRQLDNEINHLQEDLYFERGDYPRGLDEQAENASRAVAHFHHVLQRSDDRQHLMRDYQEMDRQIHQLVDLLNQSNDRWLRRQATRILYPDEQLHYVLRAASAGGQQGTGELLARQAHLLEREAENLRELSERIDHRDGRLREAVASFADEAKHFHQVVERGADAEHLQDDFRKVDEAWHQAVDRINQSAYGYYLRRTAHDVNRVHNQVHSMLTGGRETVVNPPPTPPTAPPQQVERRSGRPAIQFEIPGIGRFSIPR